MFCCCQKSEEISRFFVFKTSCLDVIFQILLITVSVLIWIFIAKGECSWNDYILTSNMLLTPSDSFIVISWVLTLLCSFEDVIEEFVDSLASSLDVPIEVLSTLCRMITWRGLGLVEWLTISSCPKVLLVPFGDEWLILDMDWLHLNVVWLEQVEPVFIVCHYEDLELVWIPMLRVYLLQVVLTAREVLLMNDCTWFADEDTVLHFEVSRLVSQTVNAVSIKLVVCHSLLQQGFEVFMLLLWDVLCHTWWLFRRCLHVGSRSSRLRDIRIIDWLLLWLLL